VHRAEFENWADRLFVYEMFSDRQYIDGRSYTHKPAEPGSDGDYLKNRSLTGIS
jgi:hypothetical protein